MPLPKTFKTATVHPTYQHWAATWQQALDVFEGTGGFMDPERPYLVPHPREWLDHSLKDATTGVVTTNPNPRLPTQKLKMRRKLARYENLAETIMTQVLGALFLHAPARTWAKNTENEQIAGWFEDVDGAGTSLTTFMQAAFTTAGAMSHAFILVEKSSEPAATAADVTLPVLRRYTPLDAIDWLTDDVGQLTGVVFREAAPRTEFGKAIKLNDVQYRVVTTEEWALYDKSGKKLDGDVHGFGRLPVQVLYAKRRAHDAIVGKSIVGDPMLHIDIYNLTSEVRELLRNQTFAILNVPLGKDVSMEKEQGLLGSQTGTGNVMFSTNPSAYISPDGTNATLYHEHIDRLSRMIYRLASQPWEGDSRDAESADSQRIKRGETSNVLSKYAGECEAAELGILELVYRALYGVDGWETKWDAEQPTVAYNSEYEPPNVEALATALAEALSLDLGDTATKLLKKNFARTLLPGADQAMLAEIDKEIDAMKVLTADDKRKEALAAVGARMGQAAEGDEPPMGSEPL